MHFEKNFAKRHGLISLGVSVTSLRLLPTGQPLDICGCRNGMSVTALDLVSAVTDDRICVGNATKGQPKGST